MPGYTEIIAAALIIAGFITGLRLMQHPGTALWGNRLGAFCMLLAVLFTLNHTGLITDSYIWMLIPAGGVLGGILGHRVRMIQMPQMVALLNGLGGGSSAVIAGLFLAISGSAAAAVSLVTALAALALGTLTFTGSIIAALKLQGGISQKPVFLPGHGIYLGVLIVLGIFLITGGTVISDIPVLLIMALLIFISALYGFLMALRIGGADMPIIIAFFNSLSGIATAVCGIVVENLFLAGAGSLVGVAGMILTRIMCRAMNRNLLTVLGGLKGGHGTAEDDIKTEESTEEETAEEEKALSPEEKIASLAGEAKKVIVVPGYGMAVAQAQQQVYGLIKTLEDFQIEVKIAIHPVAGRMPGHMNVLLAEVGVPYEKLLDMDAVNPFFTETDLVIVIGACDVVNPAANTAEGSPIYGMPVLAVEAARNIIVCNMDDKPGYSGVENTLYRDPGVIAFWGDAAETVPAVTALFRDNLQESEENSA